MWVIPGETLDTGWGVVLSAIRRSYGGRRDRWADTGIGAKYSSDGKRTRRLGAAARQHGLRAHLHIAIPGGDLRFKSAKRLLPGSVA